MMTNNIVYNNGNNSVVNQQVTNQTQNQTNQTTSNELSEFINCPQCGAKIKKNAGVCFLCGKKFN